MQVLMKMNLEIGQVNVLFYGLAQYVLFTSCWKLSLVWIAVCPVVSVKVPDGDNSFTIAKDTALCGAR